MVTIQVHISCRSALMLSLCAATCIFASFHGCYGYARDVGLHGSISRDSSCHVLVMFWNLENFFDWRDGGYSASDNEFSSYGQRHWTKGRFYAKCDAVAKSLMWTEGEYGRIPDVIGVAEVENRLVLEALTGSTSLRKYGYAIVHHDSPDPRGIDVALLYRKDLFNLAEERPVRVSGTPVFSTRDILYVCLEPVSGGSPVHFLVNHHPSKYGGEEVSVPRRRVAVETMLSVCDSVYRTGSGPHEIICMGDFNDTPDNPLMDAVDVLGVRESADDVLVNGKLVNMAGPLSERGEGTIRYQGRREMIDMFIVSPGVAARSEMEVLHIPFLTVPDNSHPGDKPFRTYSGPAYIGGVSDHCPIILRIKVVLSDDMPIFGR